MAPPRPLLGWGGGGGKLEFVDPPPPTSGDSIAFGKAPQRETSQSLWLTVSQSVSQSGKQSIRQAGRQAETHSLACFGGSLHIQLKRNSVSARPISGREAEHSVNISLLGASNPGRRRPAQFRQPITYFPRPWFKSFKAPTFDPPPPKKSGSQFPGVEGSKSKNPSGDRFVGQNNGFTRG